MNIRRLFMSAAEVDRANRRLQRAKDEEFAWRHRNDNLNKVVAWSKAEPGSNEWRKMLYDVMTGY